jgi:putative ABC transport system permease protein
VSADRLFRALLRLLPFDFRSDYGNDLARAFGEQRREARGAGPRLRLWWENIMDLLSVGVREHAAQAWQDVRYALRGMRRAPGFVAVAVATLAVGIGATVAMFSIVNGVVLRPLPYADPSRLVAVWNTWTGTDAARLSEPEYLDYAERSRTLTIAAMAGTALNIGGAGGDPERVQGASMTVNGLGVLGVTPALGRDFMAEEEVRGRGDSVLLSHAFWRRRFNADPGIVGAQVLVDGRPRLVAGVLPSGFRLPLDFFSSSPVDVVQPLALDRAAPRNRRGGHYLVAFARLAPDASAESARAEMRAILAPIAAEYPDEHDQGDFSIAVRPLRNELLSQSRDVLTTLSGAVALVLLLACANVASLILARGESRRREMATRAALGASRFRVARQLLTESVVLALFGAAAGLFLAVAITGAVAAGGASVFPRLDEVRLDRTVLLFALALGVGTGLLFGLVPALQMSYARVAGTTTDAARGAVGGRSRARAALVVCQVSLAIVLVAAAVLLIKSFVRVSQVPRGFDPAGVLTFRVSLPEATYPGRSEIAAFFSRARARLETLPGVRAAGASTGLPLAVASGDWSFDIEDRPRENGRYPGAADWYVVTPGYFEGLGIQLVRGRLPAESDDEQAPQVVFVNEATARAFFGSPEAALGKRMRMSQSRGPEQPWRTVAGIVGDVRHRGLHAAPRTEIFFPYRQFVHFSQTAQARAMTFVIKTGGAPESLVTPARSILRDLDPAVPAAQARTMEAVVGESLSDRRLNALLIGAFGAVALILAAIGLYGLLAYDVAQRAREIAVRIAVGASRASVLSLVLAHGMRLVLAGIAVGTFASLLATRALSRLLFDVQPHDVTAIVGAAVVLVAVGALASGVPARRAMRVDPALVLKGE